MVDILKHSKSYTYVLKTNILYEHTAKFIIINSYYKPVPTS